MRYCLDRWEATRRPVRFLEPCVGTGSFFSSLQHVFPEDLIESAFACELNDGHAEAARSLWKKSGLQVKHGDFLEQVPPGKKFNLLVTNPPYVRHHHLDPARKEELQALVHERLHLRISGLAGLYCYFLLLADAWLEESALSAWLIPSEFMDVNYGSAVKEYLTRRVRLLHIHRFCPTDVQFDDALVSSAIVVFEKALPDDQEVTFSLGGSLRAPAKSIERRQGELVPAEKWTKYMDVSPGHSHQRAHSVTFGDLFTIKRGLATGNNNFFILPREKAKDLGIPEQFLRPILPSPRCITNPVIEADEAGFAKLSPQLVLLDCRLPEETVAKRFPRFWEYLQLGLTNGVTKPTSPAGAPLGIHKKTARRHRSFALTWVAVTTVGNHFVSSGTNPRQRHQMSTSCFTQKADCNKRLKQIRPCIRIYSTPFNPSTRMTSKATDAYTVVAYSKWSQGSFERSPQRF